MQDSMATSQNMPLLPLRDVVVYPHMVIPLFVGREKSIKALEVAMADDKQILLVAQVNATDDDPVSKDMYTIGTVATILQLLKLPDGTVKVLVEGAYRAEVDVATLKDGFLAADVSKVVLPEVTVRETEVLVRSLLSQFEQYVKLNRKVPPEVLVSLNQIDDPSKLADTMASHMALKIAEKQELL